MLKLFVINFLWRKVRRESSLQVYFLQLGTTSGMSCIIMTHHWPIVESMDESRQMLGDIGGYPILQYCKNNWQIPKYWYHINDRSGLLEVVSISRVCLPQACIHQKSTSAITRKREKTSNWSVQWLKSPVIGCSTNFIIDQLSEIVYSFTVKSKVFQILTCLDRRAQVNGTSILWRNSKCR